jgi:hypothetical protein
MRIYSRILVMMLAFAFFMCQEKKNKPQSVKRLRQRVTTLIQKGSRLRNIPSRFSRKQKFTAIFGHKGF